MLSVMIIDSIVMLTSGLLSPLHGCFVTSIHLIYVLNHHGGAFKYVFSTFDSVTCFSLHKKASSEQHQQAIEVLLTFIRFTMTYRTQRVFGDGICNCISYMKNSTCLLYVFYHDGTLLFILWVQVYIVDWTDDLCDSVSWVSLDCVRDYGIS